MRLPSSDHPRALRTALIAALVAATQAGYLSVSPGDLALLFAFGALFGFVGVLVAVPAAAAVGVLVRFAISRYLDSDLYYGTSVVLVPPPSASVGEITSQAPEK